MKILLTKKLGLKIIYPNTFFKDKRGLYLETFNMQKYKKSGININFREDDFSINKRNVFKGIHGDNKTWKLVSCISGKIILFVVNCDQKSKKFGIYEKFILNSKKYFQVLIPPKFGNSFFVLQNNSIFHYKQSKEYAGMKSQFTYKWYDKNINLPLNKKKLIISNRDK